MRHDSFSVTAQLLTSGSSDNFLSGLATYQSELDRSNAGVQQLQLDQAKLTTLREDAAATEATVKKELAAKTVLAEEFEAKEAEAQRVYDRLSEEERQRLAAIEAERQARAAAEQAAAEARAAEAATTSRSRETTASSAPKAETQTAPVTAASSSRVQGAINAALAKVGSAYVWGTSGPNTFDCSGLTSYAYRQVGITLSRSSRTQYSSEGRKVSLSEIQPGDLVFYYSPVSHVALYIGNGKIVHAANPRSGVNVTSLHSMPITGVRRVVG
nr:C40 family peptidase [Tessaracoccus sp. MC1679]